MGIVITTHVRYWTLQYFHQGCFLKPLSMLNKSIMIFYPSYSTNTWVYHIAMRIIRSYIWICQNISLCFTKFYIAYSPHIIINLLENIFAKPNVVRIFLNEDETTIESLLADSSWIIIQVGSYCIVFYCSKFTTQIYIYNSVPKQKPRAVKWLLKTQM